MEKALVLGKIESKRKKGWQRIRQLDVITESIDMNLSKLGDGGQGSLERYGSWSHKELDMT